jgi:hypothetical protein
MERKITICVWVLILFNVALVFWFGVMCLRYSELLKQQKIISRYAGDVLDRERKVTEYLKRKLGDQKPK